jgi:hypothetical protein
MPVAIVGMHRSGTSLLAQLLQRSGLYLGSEDRLFGPSPDNPDGYWEHTGFHNLNDSVLAALGGTWDAPPVVPARWEEDPRLAAPAAEARQLLGEFSGRKPWGWKDPRTSLTLSLWLELIPDLKVIICIRNPLEVACSVQRRDRLSYSTAIRLWQLYNNQAVQAPAAARIVVAYEQLLSVPEPELARVLRFVGIAAGADVLRDAVGIARDDLRHSRFGSADLYAVDCHPDVLELYARLRIEAGIGGHELGRTKRLDTDERVVDEHALEALVGLPRSELPPSLDPAGAQPDDAQQIAQIQALVRDATTPGSTVAVISKGDERLTDLSERTALPFPQDEEGVLLGYNPSSGRSPVAQLEVARARGAEYLLIPAPSVWWLEHYPELRRHLTARYRLLRWDAETAVLFDLRTAQEPEGRARAGAIELVDAVGDVWGRAPAVLDWSTGLDLAEVLPQAHRFAEDSGRGVLPHLDASVDVVALQAADPRAVQEARRVASAATIELAPDGHLPPTLTLKLPAEGAVLREVSIVLILTDHPAAGAFLRSFEETLPHDFQGELVVVAGRRRDGHRSLLGRLAGTYERVKVVEARSARQSLSAANEGMEASTEATVVLLRGETLLLPGWLRPLLRVLRRCPAAGAVGGIVLTPDGSLLHGGGQVARDGSALDVGRHSPHPDDAPFAYVRNVDFCTSLILATRRQIFLDVNGFESGLPEERAEVDYGMAVRQLGMHCYFQPASAVVDLDSGRRAEGHGAGPHRILAEA